MNALIPPISALHLMTQNLIANLTRDLRIAGLTLSILRPHVLSLVSQFFYSTLISSRCG